MADAYIAAMEKQRAYFTTTKIIRPAQLASLEKIVTLFKEEENVAGLSLATKSRHKAARTLLRDILQQLCDEVFFLCAFVLSITWLGTVKAPNDFVERLQRWWSSDPRSGYLSGIITGLIEKFPATGT